MSSRFDRPIRHVAANSPVDAANTSRPSRELEARTNYLNDRLDAAEAGTALMLYDVTLASDTQVGQPVYLDAADNTYKLARMAVSTDSDGGFILADSAEVAGVVYAKTGSTAGTLLIAGVATLPSLTAAIPGDAELGVYYLSTLTAGQLTTARTKPGLRVLRILTLADSCGNGPTVQMLLGATDLISDHTHFRFDLTALPAGDHSPPALDTAHEITNADDALPGWLPADHASFNDEAPAGARFGYNLAQHTELRAIWPPHPLSGTVLMLDKGDGEDAKMVPQSGENPLVVIDEAGVWWMSDCYHDVPWPYSYDTAGSSSSSLSESSVSCPRELQMRLTLFVTQMLVATDQTVVTRLQPATDSPITVKDADGEDAQTGSLYLGLDLTVVTDPDEAYGGQVVKALTSSPFGIEKGYVAEGIYTSNPSITLAGSRTRNLTPGDTGTPVVHQGVIELDVDLDPAGRTLSPETVYLDGVLMGEYEGVSYRLFPNGQTSLLRARFDIPYDGLPASPEFKVRLLLLGAAAGPMSAMTAGYKQLATPGVSGTSVPGSFTSLTLDVPTATTGLLANKMQKVDSSTIEITAGDTLVIQISRAAAASPSYAAAIGLVRLVGMIVPG